MSHRDFSPIDAAGEWSQSLHAWRSAYETSNEGEPLSDTVISVPCEGVNIVCLSIGSDSSKGERSCVTESLQIDNALHIAPDTGTRNTPGSSQGRTSDSDGLLPLGLFRRVTLITLLFLSRGKPPVVREFARILSSP